MSLGEAGAGVVMRGRSRCRLGPSESAKILAARGFGLPWRNLPSAPRDK